MDVTLKIFQPFWLICLLVLSMQAQNVRTLHEKVTLADGVQLSTDLYLPPIEGAYPVVLLRTPYGKQQMQAYGNFFAGKGYATVVQEVRGTFGSTGQFLPFVNEKKDGLEVLNWLVRQPWCDGQIAGFGTSYIGFCALTLMDAQHPNLKTVFNVSGWIKTAKMNAPGGAMHLQLALPWLLNEARQRTRQSPKVPMDSLYKVVPLKNAMAVAGMPSQGWAHPEQMQRVNADFDFSKVNIPVFHIAGWYDFVKEETIETYIAINKHAKAPQKLWITPAYHNQEHTRLTKVGDVDFPEAAFLRDAAILQTALRWFDHWLKGKENGILQEPNVKVYNMFANEWQELTSFPPQNVEEAPFYLHSLQGDGRLSKKAIKNSKPATYHYNPLNPVPTWGGANFHFFPESLGIKDQRDIEQRPDVLVYTSDSFATAQDVVGQVRVRLFAATTGEDTDFTAKLVLVDGSGKAYNICDGIIRARHRQGLTTNVLLTPGKIYEFTIDLGHLAFRIQAGQRIRLEISSSNFPKFNRNFNVADDPFVATTPKPVQQTIYHSRRYSSQLILPFVQK
ncbi:MAG: CocE/NonD family hydrolase [Saprospiraceae bacterium]